MKSEEPSEIKINTEFLYKQRWEPCALFELNRPRTLPQSIPTLVLHEPEGDIDVAGEIIKLQKRCDNLSLILTLSCLFSFGLGYLVSWLLFGKIF